MIVIPPASHRPKPLTQREREDVVRRWQEIAGGAEDERCDLCHAHADRQGLLGEFTDNFKE